MIEQLQIGPQKAPHTQYSPLSTEHQGSKARPTMPKRTQVYDYHKKHGNIVDYADYELPVWFDGIIPEFKAVRSHAGLCDVSHMGSITDDGKQEDRCLNRLRTD